MGQHRKTKHYRRIVITAVAVGAVGVPSVALACTDWPYGTDPRPQAGATSTPGAQGQHLHRHHHRNGVDAVTQRITAPRTTEPVTTVPPSSTPFPSTSAPAPSAPVTPPAKARPAHARPAVRPKARPVVTARPLAQPPRPTPDTTATTPTTPTTATTPTAPTAAAPSAPAPTATATGAPASAAPASGVGAEILRLVNAERNKAGCRPLTLDPALTKAAQDHSADMAAHQNMSHTGSDGSDPGLRITRAGYTWSSYGENVAYGYTTAEQVMAGWMASPGHRANILNCGFQEIGVGLAQPGSYWTQDFGTAR